MIAVGALLVDGIFSFYFFALTSFFLQVWGVWGENMPLVVAAVDAACFSSFSMPYVLENPCLVRHCRHARILTELVVGNDQGSFSKLLAPAAISKTNSD